ncbi:hypothetical protein JSQ81_03440 [Sporosarcina sp. Marseille-Q4063]|uniref:hypothetical protein n=1 Tax=Sporosarcina sp. Marseille-Q4063 TaxID=2810514 RepID=UPI001BB0618F|nr:hypothetical protein [Sporosarcina sp. Marseille-Q4063]QUW22650.1 hypothetical protein JSQ81_03440 [Sporosarcina sp. Marseille-Q4063]
MRIYITIFLRIMLFVSLAVLVFDYLRVEQLLIQMERGFINEIYLGVNTWTVFVFIGVVFLLIVNEIFQFFQVRKNKNSILSAYLTAEYDVSDERAVENTHKAVSLAFVVILSYSFFMIGSYLFIPNYFIDHIWFPLFTTASIPIVGLLTYLITYKSLAKI